MNEQAKTPIALKDSMVLFGMLMFFLNRFMDTSFNLPVGELFLPLLVMFFAVREKTLGKFYLAPGFALTCMFLGWILMSNFYHGVSLSSQIRNLLAVSLLFLPVLLFILVKDRDNLMRYIVGGIVGFGLYFLYMVAIEIPDGTLPRWYRGIQPTPVIPLLLYVLFRDRLSRPLRIFLLGLTISSLLITYLIFTRGPLIGVVAAIGFYGLARIIVAPRIALPATLVVGLLGNFLLSIYTGNSFDTVAASAQDTISNLERAYAIDYTRYVLATRPWFGDSPQNFAISFADNFAAIMQLTEQRGDAVETPHNSFLEYSAFFGYPAGVIFLALIFRMTYAPLGNSVVLRSFVAALCLAGLLRLAGFYGLSGIWRIEWFTLMFALYYYFYPAWLTGEEIDTKPAIVPRKPLSKRQKIPVASAPAKRVS
ncbi:MAG: O-antigen ligase domain-containing protein [Alphaproteobacteria bacterium]|nr:MAG: O-antigen ligase domain-containing protein [Alphaproteobacteria bacterium]